jgi:3-keto-L-gulonate-6-phosphate decarboxylase
MLPRLWIAYDFVSIEECLTTLDAVLARHPDRSIIHEIGRPTILNAALEGVPIVAEFRARLRNGQLLVADFKGYDVPYSAEGRYYYAAGTDMITVMATAPDEAIQEAIVGARREHKLVAFDLMSHHDDRSKAKRAEALVEMGAKLISCHTGWNEQAAGKKPDALLDRVHHTLRHTPARMIAMGGLTPDSVPRLRPYAEEGNLFAIVAGSAITRSDNPHAVIDNFLNEIAKLPSLPAAQGTPNIGDTNPIAAQFCKQRRWPLGRRAADEKQHGSRRRRLRPRTRT